LELGVFLVLMVLLLVMLGVMFVAGVFMSGLNGEPLGRIAARSASTLLLVLTVMFFFG
jgi:ABC-type transport system involved in multi-copper enzyme maturation permease subunit